MDEEWFWMQLEQKYGQVSLHLKNILRLQSLCRQSLANLTEERIRHIEDDMRSMAECLTEEANAGGTPLREIYGLQFAKNPERFRFLAGEVMCLLDLAQIMRDHSATSFIRPLKKAKACLSQHPEPVANPCTDGLLDNLRRKITLHIRSITSRNDLMEKVHKMDAKVYLTNAGQYKATIICPFCEAKPSKITLSMDVTGSWHIFGFKRHYNTFHLSLPDSMAEPVIKRSKNDTKKESYDLNYEDVEVLEENITVELLTDVSKNEPALNGSDPYSYRRSLEMYNDSVCTEEYVFAKDAQFEAVEFLEGYQEHVEENSTDKPFADIIQMNPSSSDADPYYVENDSFVELHYDSVCTEGVVISEEATVGFVEFVETSQEDTQVEIKFEEVSNDKIYLHPDETSFDPLEGTNPSEN
ncbi:uncharacterized protein LOC110674213 [Aedes aegypti]|uniref:Uncharacterized protein n=1 Tax=Aedes aegypti TaxID=7159 RepID=A0A6I8U0D3_AEDAE|nr:uncharacterized protein LOC110674213 [Aedes aegypti]XP_021694040.1 uncharacterized protein LOC110674213 [Aedes aegypti]